MRRCGGISPKRALAFLIALLLPLSASADPFRLFESGTPGPEGQTHGYAISDAGFTGLRFFVPSPVTTVSIGGHFGSMSGADIFGAIVALRGPGDLPDSQDLSTPDLVGGTRIDVSPISAVRSAELAVALTPGWYALVFGSGLFGATGTGLFTLDNFPRTGQDIIGSGGLTRPGLPFMAGVLTQNRLYAFVDAQPQPVPEPTTLLLLGSGLAVLARRRSRRG